MPKFKATINRKWAVWEQAEVVLDVPQDLIDANGGDIQLAFWETYYDDDQDLSWEETVSELEDYEFHKCPEIIG